MFTVTLACIIVLLPMAGSSSSSCDTEVHGSQLNAHCMSMDLGVVGVRALALDLEHIDPHVTSMALDLQHNNIGDVGARVLGDVLQKASSLMSITLQLDGNDIKDDGARALGASLGKLQNLNSLSLSLGYNNVACQGLGDLASGIARLTQLRSLTLQMRYNQAQSSGAGSLGQSLSELKMLNFLKLDFYSNSITNVGARDVVESVAGLGDLASLSLDFRYNDIDTIGADELLKVVEKLNHITSKTVLLPKSPPPTESPQTLLEKSLVRQDANMASLIKTILWKQSSLPDTEEHSGREDWQHGSFPQRGQNTEMTPAETFVHTATNEAKIAIAATTTLWTKSDSVSGSTENSKPGSSVFKMLAAFVFAIGFIAMVGLAILWQNGYNIPELFQTSSDYVRDLIQASTVSVRQFSPSWPDEGNYRVNLSEDAGHNDIVFEAPMVEQRSEDFIPDLATRVDLAASKIATSQLAPTREMSIDELMGANLSRMQSSDRME